MTLALDRLQITNAHFSGRGFLLGDWLRRRRARRRRIRSLKELLNSPDWLLEDIGVDRDDLRERLEATERGTKRRA